jgi:GAF domain-containing protein
MTRTQKHDEVTVLSTVVLGLPGRTVYGRHMDHESLLGTARQLRERLTPGELDDTLRQITAAAVELLPNVQYSSITIFRPGGQLSTVAPTDPLLVDLDGAQYRLKEGPCFDAATHTDQVVSADLRSDARFPQYGQEAADMGIRSQIGVRLFDTPKSNGALNLYSTQAGAFEDIESLSALFANQAGVAIAYAHQIGTLQEAVQTRTLIGQAVGIVMERYDLSDERAFAFLKRLSSHRNVKLRLVAQEIVAATDHAGGQH